MREALARSRNDFVQHERVDARGRRAQANARARIVGSGNRERAAADAGLLTAASRRLLANPGRAALIVASVALAAGIVVNALALQEGAHPNPLFGAGKTATVVAQPPAAVVAKPEPVKADARESSATTASVKPAPVAAVAASEPAARRNDMIGDLLRGGSAPMPPPRPTAIQVAASAKPVASTKPAAGAQSVASTQPPQPPLRPEASTQLQSAQKALARIGFGPLTADGLMGAGTRGAIERFEKSKGLPVTGELGARTLKALSGAAGTAIR